MARARRFLPLARQGEARPMPGSGLGRVLPGLMLLVAASLLLSGCQPPPSGGLQSNLTPILLPTRASVTERADSSSASTPTPMPTATGQLPGETTPQPTPVSTPAVSQATATAMTASPTVTPTVGARLLALGVRPSLALRAVPATSSAALQVVPGSEVLWAEGRSPDGRWLLVTYDGGERRAWVAKGDVTLFGDEAVLAVATPEARAVASQTPLPAGEGVSGVVIGERLNIRSGPGVDQPVLGQLVRGDAVTALGRTEDGAWLSIARGDGQAWVAAQYIDLAGNTDGLPITARQTGSGRVPRSSGGSVRPAGSGSGGKIAFETRSGGDIYVMGADGSGLRRVAAGLDPVLSPDGTRLAYARWDAPQGIYVLDLRTGEEKLVAGTNRPRGPTWSPDGSRLAFNYSTRSYVCLMSPWGCLEEEVLRKRLGGECTDTPFGRYCIADFPSQMVDQYGLVQVNLADGAWQDLPAQKTVQSPQWHPKSDEILYRGDKGLQVTALAGDTRPLVENPDLGSPAWSPDGQQIAVQQRLHDHFDLFILDAAGNVQRRLTTPPDPFARAPDNVAPAWSPDGKTILFLSNRDGSWRLYRMNADGSNQALLLPASLGDIKLNYDFAAERMVSWAP